MAIHSLKTDPKVFDAVFTGVKTYELRKNTDRVFRVRDLLRLNETQYTGAEMAQRHNGAYPGKPVAGKPLIYTGRQIVVEITHMLNGPRYGLEAGWSILSVKPINPEMPAECEPQPREAKK